VIPSKRRVIGSTDVLIPTDLREWIALADSHEIREVLSSLDLPHTKRSGDFDKRARMIWQYVASHVEYVTDSRAQRTPDFWQFPAETLALGKGDCEDCAFLLASLLLASGISPYCVRVVMGTVTQADGSSSGHAWTLYKTEAGRWVVLEGTLNKVPAKWPLADDLVRERAAPRYFPDLCLNRSHVWTVDGKRRIRDVASYLRSYRRRAATPATAAP
jgi:predicted transglutaminase-like cysteine proteinase